MDTVLLRDLLILYSWNRTGIVIFPVYTHGINHRIVLTLSLFCSQLAVAGEDYTLTSGTLTFATKDLSQSFFLQITNDMISEVDEYIFVAITSVQLDVDSVENVDNSGMFNCYHLPFLGRI